MGKVITSPVKRYPGTVTIPDPMSWDQLSKWGDFIAGLGNNTFDNLHAEALFLPSFVERFDIQGYPDNFDKPPKNMQDFMRLIAWLTGEIWTAINGDEITPFSESGSTSG